MLDDRPYMRRSAYRSAWSMTTLLLIVNVVAFVLQNALEHYRVFPVSRYLALSADGLKHGAFYQLFTFQFLHDGPMHLIGNLLVIFFFGRAVEEVLGRRNFLLLYFLSGTIGGLLQIALGFTFPGVFGGAVLGASAGAFGLIAAFATRAPDQPITILLFFVLPLTFPAKVLLAIQAAIAVFGIVIPGSNIAHAAHLGGMFTGILFIKWLGRSNKAVMVWRPFRRRPTPREMVRATPRRDPWKPKVVEPELPPAEFISQEVDPILDKISAHGIQSLTDRERQILEAARKKMSKR